MRPGNTSHLTDPGPEYPGDIAGIAKSLDAMARVDHAGAVGAIEDRVFVASLPALKGLGAEATRLDTLATIDQDASGPGFEERIVGAVLAQRLGPRGEGANVLVSGGLRIAGDGRLGPVVRARRWASAWRVGSIAAVLMVGVGAMMVWRTAQPTTPIAVPQVALTTVSTEALKADLDEGFDTLLAAMSDVNLTITKDSDSDSSTNWTEFSTEEGAS